MKTTKIIISAASIAILCFFTWSRSIATKRTNPFFSIVSSNSTIPIQDVKRANELRNAFWRLVNSGIENKESYDRLIRTYVNNKPTAEDIAILNYLKKICKDSESFHQFIKLPRITRQKAKSLTDISID